MYPAEIEQVLVRTPGVESIAVFGVDDERWGQRVCAAIVGDAQPHDVIAFAGTKLAGYKCPKAVYVVDDLPYTSTGKLRRVRLPEVVGLTPPAAGAADRTLRSRPD